MDISRRTDYAIRLVAALIIARGKTLSVREASELQDVPYAFARNIQYDLARAGLIKSERGAHGGMRLLCSPEQTTLLELVEAVQGKIAVAVCTTESAWCRRDEHCQFHNIWENLNLIIRDYLSSITLAAVIDGKKPYLSANVQAIIAQVA